VIGAEFGVVVDDREFRVFRGRPENSRSADFEIFRRKDVIDAEITDGTFAVREISRIERRVCLMPQVCASLPTSRFDAASTARGSRTDRRFSMNARVFEQLPDRPFHAAAIRRIGIEITGDHE
jgi:hypothetical protein